MEGSRVWYKISIVGRLESFDEKSLCKVIEFMKDELDCMLPNKFHTCVTSYKEISSELLFSKHKTLFTTNNLSDIWNYVSTIKADKCWNSNNNKSRNESDKKTNDKNQVLKIHFL